MTNSSNTPSILQGIRESLGEDVLEKIISSKLLVVGAGGIGCELLKDLSLSGFRHMQVIDLDTIDVSNLNRQLLFRQPHVGQPKCVVGVKVAADMSPFDETAYTAHHGNVCDNSQFNVPFVQKFDVVLNALDNVTARRRVNRLCLAADVPMIEAGTTGYLGQVQTIQKGVACYECKTQEPPKVYPICTIRSTPSRPVHTIVWAKELYKLLLGEDVVQSMLYEDEENDEPSTFMKYATAYRKAPSKEVVMDLLKALYVTEIQKQLDMDRYSTAEKTPKVLEIATDSKLPAWNPMGVWTLSECLAELENALLNEKLPLNFDKDDEGAMRFVTAAANLRCLNFQIPTSSFHATKGIAGNIIPAIATTNAIVAGLQILQVFCILKDKLEGKTDASASSGKYINCLRQPTRNGLYLAASGLEEPNPNCYVCSQQSLHLALQHNECSLQTFVDTICKAELGLGEPIIYIGEVTVWEEGEGAEVITDPTKALKDLPNGGIQHGSQLTLEDFSQELTVNVSVVIPDVWEYEIPDETAEWNYYIVGGAAPKVAPRQQPEVALAGAKPAPVESAADDDVIELIEDDDVEVGEGRKRPATGLIDQGPAKKARAAVIEVIDD